MESKPKKLVEYIHKNSSYVFPPGTTLFTVGESLTAEIKKKRVPDLSCYLRSETNINKNYKYSFGLPVTAMGANLIKEYEPIAEYMAKHPKISFLQFDHATSNEIALCTFFKPMDFVKAGNLISDINRSLPFLINIFRRPLIHLHQAEIIQPVDAVKRINQNTVRYLTRHAEHWKDIDYQKDEIVPSKLLTRVYEDDYGIYENLVFRDLVDGILAFLRKRIYYLTEILETFKESIQLDAVNRFNHQKYYLAIGKLYVGFYKMENSSEIQATLENIKHLYSQINKYKSRAVYTKNARLKAVTGDIKRTNILTMHKDYKHVFALSQKFRKNSEGSKEKGSPALQNASQKSYEHFCAMLTVFAVSNFNMESDTDDVIFSKGDLFADFANKDWKTIIRSEYNEILGFNIIVMSVSHLDTTKNFAIIPMSYHISSSAKKRVYEGIVERLYRTGSVFDKYVFAEPFDTNENSLIDYSIPYKIGKANLMYAVLPISVTDINSFRRIQKLVFEGLVLSNKAYDTCAFCGDALTAGTDNSYLCKKCKTGIKIITCSHCLSEFTATYVAVKNNAKTQLLEDVLNTLPEFFKQEKKYLFRNIVNMNKNNYICPYCNGEN